MQGRLELQEFQQHHWSYDPTLAEPHGDDQTLQTEIKT